MSRDATLYAFHFPYSPGVLPVATSAGCEQVLFLHPISICWKMPFSGPCDECMLVVWCQRASTRPRCVEVELSAAQALRCISSHMKAGCRPRWWVVYVHGHYYQFLQFACSRFNFNHVWSFPSHVDSLYESVRVLMFSISHFLVYLPAFTSVSAVACCYNTRCSVSKLHAHGLKGA